MTEELEKEERIKELENMLKTQKGIIEKQYKKIMTLEGTARSCTESNYIVNNIVPLKEEDDDKISISVISENQEKDVGASRIEEIDEMLI